MSEGVRVAIVGAGGRVGSAILEHLASVPGIRAFGIVRNALIAGPLRLTGLEVRCGSIRDKRSADALVQRPDVIVNCAVSAGWASVAPAENRTLIAALAQVEGVSKLIQFSSIGVYGNCISRRRAAPDRPRPRARYAREKLDQERSAVELSTAARTYILRMGHVYGPYQWLSRSIFDFLTARAPELPFDGAIPSNAVYIGNVCRAIAWLATRDEAHGSYDLVDRPQHTWRSLVDWHAAAIRVPTLAGMGQAPSADLARRYRAIESVPFPIQLLRGSLAALASGPAGLAASSSIAIEVGQRVLAALGRPGVEARLRAAHARARVRGRPITLAKADPPPWLVSDETPGRILPYPARPLSHEDQLAVAEWYLGYSVPAPVDG